MDAKLYLTYRCHLDCPHCPERAEGLPMPLEVGQRAIEFVLDHTGEGEEMGLSFWGGEPLLSFSTLRDLAIYARDAAQRRGRKVRFALNTNGLLPGEEVIDFCRRLSFSVILRAQGGPCRNEMGELKKALSQWARALEEVPIQVTVAPQDATSLFELVEQLMEMGCRNLTTTLSDTANWTEEEMDRLKAEYRKIAEDYLERLRRGEEVYFHDIDSRLHNRIRPRGYKYCGAGIREVSITPEGEIHACLAEFYGKRPDPIGHIDVGFDQERRAAYQNYSPKRKMPCQRCVLREVCFHECVALNFQVTGDLYATPWGVCEREKALIAQADRLGNLLYQERNPIFLRRFYGWTVEGER